MKLQFILYTYDFQSYKGEPLGYYPTTNPKANIKAYRMKRRETNRMVRFFGFPVSLNWFPGDFLSIRKFNEPEIKNSPNHVIIQLMSFHLQQSSICQRSPIFGFVLK